MYINPITMLPLASTQSHLEEELFTKRRNSNGGEGRSPDSYGSQQFSLRVSKREWPTTITIRLSKCLVCE